MDEPAVVDRRGADAGRISEEINVPPSSHFIYIPVMLVLGLVLGFILGAKATRDAVALESRRAADRLARRAARAAAAAATEEGAPAATEGAPAAPTEKTSG